jgi:DNA-directed RNA polymerase subunit delta
MNNMHKAGSAYGRLSAEERGDGRMSELQLRVSQEHAREMPMVDLAYEILMSAKKPYYYRDLMREIAVRKHLGDEEVMRVIAQVYTEINIDGRFACVGNNVWGLKRWYPVEKADDATGATSKRPRIINEEDDIEDDDLYIEEQEEEFDMIPEEPGVYDAIEGGETPFFDEDENEEIEAPAEFARADAAEEEEETEEVFAEVEPEIDPLDEVDDIDDMDAIEDDGSDEDEDEDEDDDK